MITTKSKSATMNFESWQAQQKAQKDEERKRKTQAAEALRSYKGEATNAEASKLAQLKEQDRQQKLEAERQLREYRGTISEEDTKLTNYKEEERRKKQEAANLLRGYQGTLSEEEAKLAAAREDERRKKQQAQEQLYRNLETTKGENNCSADEAIAPGSVSAMAGVFNAPAPMPRETTAMQLAVASDSACDNRSPESVPGSPEIVKFMFGLIAVGEFVSLDGYLETIDQMVTNTVGEETKKKAKIDYPSVLSIKIDSNFMPPTGRIDIVRRLVTVAIPFVPTDKRTGKEIKRQIVEAARLQIQSGGFQKAY